MTALDAKTPDAVNATAVTSITGTATQVKAVIDAAGITQPTNFGVVLTGEFTAAEIDAIGAANGTGTITFNGTTNVDTLDFTDVTVGLVINGLAGADIITGGSGNDTIIGGAGADLLTGGAGNDTFVFAAGDTGITVATADTITDFGNGANLLSLGLAGSVAVDATFNYVEAVAAVADFAAALAAANIALAADDGEAFESSTALVRYAFEFDATNG
jgi:Ca2+-binding RTX toxin-like protein